MFCTDMLFELDRDMDSPADAWEVTVAVLNKVFKGKEPKFSKKYLRRYYEDLLFTTQSAYSKYKADGRSKTSAENGKKGGRPPMQGEEQAKTVPVDEYHEKVRAAARSQQRKRIYERICEDPFKFCEGASWEDITQYFYDLEGEPSNLREALQTLHKNRLISFTNEGNKFVIKQLRFAGLKKSE